ncbi:glycosyltransferase [Larkinella rosea]|uniref:Glycosyltransferase family 1 protein n=1 Tax=Larkinella rosea TaxID=2025312 RepID=A0A3P1BJK2_9BACT|nr:glycosyltransferase [Larkinella rosea]RRB01238.1 glycosyltransferase family 1 protein [Larkinella rosea]
MNFVITSRQAWEEKNLGSNIRDMARSLSNEHQVLFINDPLDWSSKFAKDSPRVQQRSALIEHNKGERLVQAEKNLWVLSPQSQLASINWLPDGVVYDQMNRYNGKLIAAEIKLALKKLKWGSFVLLNDNDMLQGFYLKEFLKPLAAVYYLRDNFLAVDYWKRHGERLEPKLMGKVDLVASNSIYLANQAARYNPNSVYVGQGCDLSLFDPAKVGEVPADMAVLPKPIVGYAGALTGLRLDVDLIETVAIRRPEWQIVLIGSTDDSFQKERLEAVPNIKFLGSKPSHQIPAYVAGMDVLINPQILNEVTIGNYPRKIDEYLAMGKPVVALKTETMSLFEKHVYLAETPEQFITGIDNALNGKQLSTPEERIAFALEHTWENSLGLMINAIEQLIAAQPQTA